MITDLMEMYEDGAITGYQVMMDCLHTLDPNEPELVLGHLPEEILEEMLDYARRYDPRRTHSTPRVPPAEDQVRSAEHWIQNHRLKSSKAVNL